MRRICGVSFLLVMSYCAFAQLSNPIQFKDDSFDFGVVVEENGPVLHEFQFTNSSSKPVQILAVKPSCGCTTPGWSKEPILPGKTGSIKAEFDPAGRPGYFSKSLAVTTDADSQPITLLIKGTVSSKNKVATSELQAASGNLRMKSLSINFGKIYRQDEFVVREHEVINAGTKPVTYLGKFDGPSYIRVSVEPQTIQPGQDGIIKISYNGKLKNLYGFQSDNIVLHTDDENLPKKSLNLYATLEDYFPEVKPEEIATVPKLRFTTQTLDFGSMRQNQPVVKEFQVVNSGKSILEIRSVVGNCTCIQAEANKLNLKAGENASVKITFNPQDRKGTQTKSVTVYSNDPQNPVQRITLTGVVD